MRGGEIESNMWPERVERERERDKEGGVGRKAHSHQISHRDAYVTKLL